MRYHLTPVRMAIINKATDNKRWWGCRGRESSCTVGGNGAATLESSMVTPQRFKNGTAFWPSDPTYGNISKECQNTNSKEHKHPYVHCSVIYNHQYIEAAQVSINRWVDKPL